MSINAVPERIWECLKTVDINRSPISRALFALRRLPAGRSSNVFPLTVDKMTLGGFIPLGERPTDELVLGLIGKPWSPRYGARAIKPAEFQSFAEDGFAKMVWNFKLSGEAPPFRLSTESRVRCVDEPSRRKFKLYWSLIWPFSGFIRMELLRIVRDCAQSA
jgi:hypothetical protein